MKTIYQGKDLISRYEKLLMQARSNLDENRRSVKGTKIHAWISRKLRYCFFGGDLAQCRCTGKKMEKDANEYVGKVIEIFKGLGQCEKYIKTDEAEGEYKYAAVGIECDIIFPRQFITSQDDPKMGRIDCLFVVSGAAYIFDYKYGEKIEVSPDDKTMKKYAVAVYRKYGEGYNIKETHLIICQPKFGDEIKEEILTYENLYDFTRDNYNFKLRQRHIP